MAVIESTMTLYAKEVVTPDRVMASMQRLNHDRSPPPVAPENYEQGLLLWISHTCDALKKRIEQDLQTNVMNGGGEVKLNRIVYFIILICNFFRVIN